MLGYINGPYGAIAATRNGPAGFRRPRATYAPYGQQAKMLIYGEP
jgi:hypothetical protein